MIKALDHDIWLIDTDYVAPGVAACYLLRDGDDYALIECGTGLSAPAILRALNEINVARECVRLIIPTHVHLDHAGGAGALMQALPNAQLHVHPRGARHLIDPSKLLAGATAVYGEEAFARLNGEILPVPAERCHEAPDGTVLLLGQRRLELRDAPGHARHHLVIWDSRSGGFFTGDVFGLCYPQLAVNGQAFIAPTTTPVQFDPAAWHQTLAMMASYQPKAMYLTHYGRVSGVEGLSRQLAQRVDQHAQIGRQHAQLGEAALARLLGDALYGEYRDAGGQLERRAFDDVLEMDLQLNAQGLIFWVENTTT